MLTMGYIDDIHACNRLMRYNCILDLDCRYIFSTYGKRFFRCLARLHGWKRAKQIHDAERYNIGKPPCKRRRVPYWKPVLPDNSESSDTTSSSSGGEEDDKCPFYAKSQKITPHAVEHFAEQVVMGGTHSFHDTDKAESRHPECVQKAAARARTYSDLNLSASKMLEYILDSMQIDKIVEIATGNVSHLCIQSLNTTNVCNGGITHLYPITISHQALPRHHRYSHSIASA